MTALIIILAIILFFILLLSIKVKITVHSEDGVELSAGWLFLKFKILPKDKDKKKKKKKEKKKKEPKEEPKDETVKEPKKKKGDNIFVKFYRNNGVSGFIELAQRLAEALGGMFRGIARAFTFEQLYVSLLTGSGDSADTAVKYGKTCAAVFPAMGLIVDTMRVKKYSVEVLPDFIEGKNSARLHTVISVIPRRLINAVIAFGVRALFRVVLKFLKGTRATKPETEEK